MAAQNSMFSGQLAMSHQLSYQSLAALNPGMMPPSPAAAFNQEFNYGERAQGMAMGAAGWMGSVGAPMAMAGLAGFGALNSLTGFGGMAGRMAGAFDPFGTMLRGGRIGYGMMGGGLAGIGGGVLGAAAGALPFYAAGMAASAYSGAAMGGMQDQSAINSMLGQNFNFSGGGGMMGRGFSQGQMGQIGGVMHQMARQDPFSSLGELTSLVGAGSQMGMFTAVRDVREFTKKFKDMISTLKTVQDELGGSLHEALQFVHEAKQSGIFKSTDRAMFSGLVRRTADVSGLSQENVMRMTSYGSHLARSMGGTGAQGAVGATLALQQVGAAVQGGILSGEMLSEATGGLTGDNAMMAFSQNMMQRVARETRRGFGRYSIFGLANEEGTGIDSGKMARFLAGDLSMSEIGRSAHQTVARMGRPKAMRNEGLLRAAAIQQGGIAFEAGKIRALLGDRVMMQDDDMVQAVLQKRFRMNRGEAEAMTAMIRNLPEISTRMAIESEQSDISRAQTNYQQENQSFESIKRRIGSAVQEGLGIADTREWGRKLFSTVGAAVEKFTDDLFGIARQEFSQTGRDRVRRVMMGQGTASDFAALAASDAKIGGAFSGSAQIRGGLLQMGPTEGAFMQAAGIDVAGMSGSSGLAQYSSGVSRLNQAMETGYVSGEAKVALAGMQSDQGGTLAALAKAAAYGKGNRAKTMEYLKRQGINGEAALAFAQENKLDFGQGGPLTGTMQSGDSAAESGFGGFSRLILGAFGFDYSGASGGAQQLEDLIDRTGYRIGDGLEESDIQSALSDPGIGSAVQSWLRTPGSGNLDKDLAGVNRAILNKDLTPEQRTAAQKVMQGYQQRLKSGLSVDEYTDAMFRATTSPEDEVNQRAQAITTSRMRGRFGLMADKLGGGEAAKAFLSFANEGDYTGIRRGQMAMLEMSPEDRSAALASLGGEPEAVATRQAVMALSRERRELSGGGRRGQWGARDAMHATLDAGVSNNLEVTLGNGRVLNSRQSRFLLDQGLRGRQGKAGQAAISEYRNKLVGELGLSEDVAEQMIGLESSLLRDGKLDKKDAKAIQEFRDSSGVTEKLTQYQKQTQARQDPLSSERNQHLKQISEHGAQNLVIMKEMLMVQSKTKELSKDLIEKLAEAKVGAAEAS